MDQQNKLEYIHRLFLSRHRTYNEMSDAIVKTIRPTVLDAVVEVLETSFDNVSWWDINFYDYNFTDYSDAILVISCMVEYESEDAIPAIIHEITAAPDVDTDEPTKRLVRVGLPFEFVVQSKDDIKTMLYKTLLSELTAAESDFDDDNDGLMGSSEFDDEDDEQHDEPKSQTNYTSWLENLTKGKIH